MFFKRITIFILVVFISFSLLIPAGCKPQTPTGGGGSVNPNLASWTILFYFGGTNNLEKLMELNILELEAVGSNPKFNMVVQFSRESKGGEATRYKIEKSSDPNQIVSQGITLGRVDSASYKTLEDFIAWGIENFPANQYALVISSHGGGFTGIVEDTVSKSFMSAIDLQKALRNARFRTGRKMDVLHIYSCLMGQVEVISQFKDDAEIIVASEVSQYMFKGLDKVYAPLATSPGISRGPLSKLLVDKFIEGIKEINNAPQIYVAIDMTQLKTLEREIDNLSLAMLASWPWYGDRIKSIYKSLPPVDDGELYNQYRDLQMFVEALLLDPGIQDSRIKNSASSVLVALNKTIYYKAINPGFVSGNPKLLNMEDASGLSIFLPAFKFPDYLYSLYSKLDFALDTSWLSFLYIANPDILSVLPQYNINKWVEYKDEKGFSLKLPESPLFEAKKTGAGLIFLDTALEVKDSRGYRLYGGPVFMEITVTEGITEQDVDSWATKEEAKLVPLYSFYKRISKSPEIINKVNAIRILSGGTSKEGDRFLEQHLFILRDGKGYDIYYKGDEGLFYELVDIFVQISRSLKF